MLMILTLLSLKTSKDQKTYTVLVSPISLPKHKVVTEEDSKYS